MELFGDRWTLLIVRDLALKGRHSFNELLEGGEGISTNILAERLTRLEGAGLVIKKNDPSDGRRYRYELTEAGKDLLPTLVEIIVWSASVDPNTETPDSFVRRAKKDRAGLLRALRAKLDS